MLLLAEARHFGKHYVVKVLILHLRPGIHWGAEMFGLSVFLLETRVQEVPAFRDFWFQMVIMKCGDHEFRGLFLIYLGLTTE